MKPIQNKVNSKTGTETSVVIQKRDLTLLAELLILRLVLCLQTVAIGLFRSRRRAHDRLSRLVAAGVLRRYFIGTVSSGRKAIYALSTKGAALIGAPKPRIHYRRDQLITADQFVSHQLQINEVFLTCKYRALPRDVRFEFWRTFSQPLAEHIRLIPDGYCQLINAGGARCLFLEVDLGTESLRIWKEKIQMYIQLAISGDFQRLFNQPQFRVAVIAPSERRLKNIVRLIAQHTDKIFWLGSLENINSENFWSAVWRRPNSDQLHSLL